MSRVRGRARARGRIYSAVDAPDPGDALYTVEGDGIFKTVRRAAESGAVIWPTSKTGAIGTFYFETELTGTADASMHLGLCNADFTAAEGATTVNTLNLNDTDARAGGVSIAHADLGVAGPRGIVTRWLLILPGGPQWAIVQDPNDFTSAVPVPLGGMSYTSLRPYWRFTTAEGSDWTCKILTKESNFVMGLPAGATAWDEA